MGLSMVLGLMVGCNQNESTENSGQGDTDTSGNTEVETATENGKPESETDEASTAESEVNTDEVDEYLEPIAAFENINLYGYYYERQNNELITYPEEYKQATVAVSDGESQFDLKFRWGFTQNGKLSVREEAFFTEYVPGTKEGYWSVRAVEGQEDLVWIWHYMRQGLELKTLSIYSISQEKIIAEFDISQMGVYVEDTIYCDAEYIELGHIVVTTARGLFVYDNNEWIDYTEEFSPLKGQRIESVIIGDKVLYYATDPRRLMSFVYDSASSTLKQIVFLPIPWTSPDL